MKVIPPLQSTLQYRQHFYIIIFYFYTKSGIFFIYLILATVLKGVPYENLIGKAGCNT